MRGRRSRIRAHTVLRCGGLVLLATAIALAALGADRGVGLRRSGRMSVFTVETWHGAAHISLADFGPAGTVAGRGWVVTVPHRAPQPAWLWWFHCRRERLVGLTLSSLTVPLWLPAGLGLGLFLISRRRVQSPGHCPNCGYDLNGVPAPTCPECGA